MDKRGMAWSTLAIIIVLIVSFVIIFGVWLYYSGYLSEATTASRSQLLEAWKS